MDSTKVAGMSMKGGRKDQFVLCLLEFYPDKERWFLRSILQVKDEKGLDGDDVIRSWIDNYEIHEMVVDFPLSNPACHECKANCPGADNCPVSSVAKVRKKIDEILEEDRRLQEENPKAYERARNKDDEFDFTRDIMAKEPHEHILSRPFKRRLKKGFLPYWNRPVDFWVWSYYYDQLLDLFNTSYDSFGNTSIMVQARFDYLKRHFPSNFEIFEGNTQIALIELLRAGIIFKKDILNLSDIELGIEARLDIIKKVEESMNIFIYDHDLDIMTKNIRAFEAFILAVVGQSKNLGKNRPLPDWTYPKDTNLIIPSFK